MNTRANKKTEVQNQAADHKQQGNGQALQLVDSRPEAMAQKQLQEAANQSPRSMQLKALQNMADNSSKVKQSTQLKAVSNTTPVQLFKGAEGTNQEDADIPFTFAQEFTNKHIAADRDAAIANTQTRIDDAGDRGGQSIRAGNIGNTVATDAVWTAAINANTDVIPDNFRGPSEDDKADPAYNEADYDDSGHSGDSSAMRINVWEVRYANATLTATQKDVNAKVAGTYDVTNLDVSIDIDHATQ